MMTRFFVLIVAIWMLQACSGSPLGGGNGHPPTHGPSIHGYGPVAFGTPKQAAFQMLQGRGQFQRVPGGDGSALVYMDYIDYLTVRVVQHFDEQDMAEKAEVFVMDAQQMAKSLNECRSLNFTVYNKLQNKYGPPDWAPKINSRRYGESGVLVYTFADSSNIQLNYDYASQNDAVGLCTVKLTFNPPWAM
jgi:hypothetical protein